MKDPRSTLSRTLALLVLFAATLGWAAPAPLSKDDKARADMNHAVSLLQQGKLNEADAAFQQTLSVAPDDFDASLGRAQVAVDRRQVDKADQMISAVLKRSPSLPEAHNMKGVVLLLRNDNAGASSEFRRAIDLNPQYITPYIYLAVMSRIAGDFSGAEAQYRTLIRIAPKLSIGYLGAAEALTMQRREADAIQVLQLWKSVDPSTVLPYKVIAQMHLADHKPKEALTELNAALAKKPYDSGLLTLLGDAYRGLGDIPAAATRYDAALAVDHANTAAADSLGELEASIGQTDRALLHFRMALAADPRNAVAANDTAWLLLSQGKDLDQAQRLAQTAVKTAPKYPDAYDTLGWIEYNRGQYALAVESLRQAQTLAPSNPDIAGHLGLAYAKLGRRAEALAELQQALKPNSAVANRPQLQAMAEQLSHPATK